MIQENPKNARCAARVILLNREDHVLFLHAEEPKTKHRFWVMPGGGLNDGESFEEAAYRETFEETGIEVSLGPCVWIRRHRHTWNGKPADQYERFFFARTDTPIADLIGTNLDDYIIGHRWWSLDELKESDEEFAPGRVAALLPQLLLGDLPDIPFDCGV
jgi:8-oxo-dGTP pyrophosphatase MutT (NUDIX family)